MGKLFAGFPHGTRRTRPGAPPPAGAAAPTAGGPGGAGAATPAPAGPGGFGAQQQQQQSYAIVVSTGPEDYVIIGAGVQLKFSVHSPDRPRQRSERWEKYLQGLYKNGYWIPGRRLNGDDIMVNYDAQNKAVKDQSGQGLRLAGDAPRILRLKLYRY